MNPNSLEAFNKIKANGSLPRRRLEMFEIICREPGKTREGYIRPNWKINQICPRVLELIQHGLVEEYGLDCRSGFKRDRLRPTGNTEVKPLEKKEKMDKRGLLDKYRKTIEWNYIRDGMFREDIHDLEKEILGRMK